MNDATETYYAEMESARNTAEDAYFKARPQLRQTLAEQALFRAGFERAFQLMWDKLQQAESRLAMCSAQETSPAPSLERQLGRHEKWCNVGKVSADGLWMACNCGLTANR